jgi:two-component system OmpR family response regulator
MRVLVVEDERPLATALQRGLASHGFAVETASDGLTGYLLARDEQFDVIVLDVMLPERNGYEVCERLRTHGVTTPIIMLTALDDELDEAEALDLGADDFLRKPFSYVVLVARLNALLRRPIERPMVLRSGDLRLDPGRRTANFGGFDIDLTPRELSLLEYLLRNAGRTLSKRDILDHVWGADFERDPNVVQVYIGYLRRKIDDRFGTPVIETVRGHGYRLATTDDG